MQRIGIIAEYNPFHNGHALQIDTLRSRGAEGVVVVMSGNYAQRGTPAVFSKFTRARAALACGADLVAELPVPWAAAGADRFAEGGVWLLAALGCDGICFGAEEADLAKLTRLAALLEDPAFDAELQRRHTAGGGSLAALRAALVGELEPGAAALLAKPNNTLGIAYLRAIRRLGLPLKAIALPRTGAQHDAPLPAGGHIASASALRGQLLAGNLHQLAPYLPPAAYALFCRDAAAGALLDERAFSTSLLTVLRGKTPGELAHLPGAGGEGLPFLLARAAATAGSANEVYDLLKSKRYTHAKLRRLALAAYLGLTDDLPRLPPYLRLLGGTPAGLAQLAGMRDTRPVPLCHSLAQLVRMPGDAGRVAALEARAGALWSLCLQTPHSAREEFTQKFMKVPGTGPV